MDQYRKQQARYEVGNPYGRTAKHTAHTDQQLGAPNDGVQPTQESLRPYNSFVPINKKSASNIKSKEDETDFAPNRSRRNLVTKEGTITDAGPATPMTINNNNMHLITNEWDHKAFPDAKKDWIIEKLVAGGHRSIEIIRPRPTYKAHSLTIYLSHFKEFMEHFDPWAMEKPKDFERQWLLLNKFVRSYHDDLPHLSGTSVDDEKIALTKIERTIETEALEKGMSSKSFWVFWVHGMRESLGKLTSNWSPRSKSA
ncbi:hypothetical protein F4825DRAFT_438519 [Nemania diffusa]|nr:hypothetical protein F4825DRAFT_438519 [Nemania diffusa]